MAYGVFDTHRGKKAKRGIIIALIASIAIFISPKPTQQAQNLMREGAQGGGITVGRVYPSGAPTSSPTAPPSPSAPASQGPSLEEQVTTEVTSVARTFAEELENYSPSNIPSLKTLTSAPQDGGRQEAVKKAVEERAQKIQETQETQSFTIESLAIESLDFDGNTANQGTGKALVVVKGTGTVTSAKVGGGGNTAPVNLRLTLEKTTDREKDTRWVVTDIERLSR